MKTTTRFQKFFAAFFILFVLSTGAYSQLDTTFSLPPGYFGYQLRYRNVLKVNPSGDVWVGFTQIGVGVFNGSSWTVYDRNNSLLPGNNVLSLAFSGNTTWIGTDSGLVKFDGVNWTLYDSTNSGIKSNFVKNLFADGNTLWIAFNTGIQLFDGTNWTDYSTANGLVNDTVQCFAKTSSSIFFGTRNGVSEFRSGSWINYAVGVQNTDSNNIFSIEADANDTLFVSPRAGGLEMKTGNYFQLASQLVALNCGGLEEEPLKLMKSVNGSMICLYKDGYNLYEYSTNTFEIKKYSLALHEVYPGTIQNELCDVDPAGRIWRANRNFPDNIYRFDYINYWPAISPLAPGYGELNLNQVRALLHTSGSLFWDGIGTAKYQVPNNGCDRSALFCQSLWLGGLDNGNQLHMAAQTYRQSGDDFWPGPIDTTTHSIDSATSAQFNKIWVIERWKIMEFISNFNAGNVANGTYAIPIEILSWPGNATGAQFRDMAPYVDVDLDGHYDPYAGDYPDIRGDQMAWWVMNDMLHPHGETGGAPLGVQIQVSAYEYACPAVPDSDRVINYTTFYHYKIINFSINDYHDVYAGLFTDVDLGNFTDDFVGCNVDNDFGYGYNGDSFDEGVQGYGANPPVINVAVLKGPLADPADAIDNNHNGIIDEPGETWGMSHFTYYDNDFTDFGNPETTDDYYGYMMSLWKNGSPVTYGANGHVGTDTCNYMFPGDSDPTGYGTNGIPHAPWNEYTAGNVPADRRFIMSLGPVSMPAGNITTLDYAVVYTRDENAANYPQDNLAKNLTDVQKVKNWWTADNYPSACALTIGIPEISKSSLSSIQIYPNPVQDGFYIDVNGKSTGRLHYELTDMLGRIVMAGEIRGPKHNFISSADFAPGIYFIRVTGKDFSANAKLVKD